MGDFLSQDLDQFPRPEAAFIGGHGGRLPEFVQRLTQIMDSDGIIVFNSVSPRDTRQLPHGYLLGRLQITYETVLTVDEHNPITILQAKGSQS